MNNNFRNIKLVATDMDGTFVKEGMFELPEEDFDLIRKLNEHGVIFAAASGRPYGNMRRMFAPVADDMLFICDNGCNVMWHGKNIYTHPMNLSACREIADYIQTLPPEYENVMCTADNYVMMPKRDEDAVTVLRRWNMSVRIVSGLENVVDEVLKISVFKPGGIEREFIDEMKRRWNGKVRYVTESCSEWLDFQDGDKGNALKIAAKQLGIDLADIAAFGDGNNDIEMLKTAGYGFAMSSACDEVKAYARYECSDVRTVLREILAQHK